jgi:hypothetical protein
MNFRYADKAEMMTVAWLLVAASEEEKCERCGFESVPGFRGADAVCRISAPFLTFREMRALDRALTDPAAAAAVPVSEEDRRKYLAVYRYFPAFTEAEL